MEKVSTSPNEHIRSLSDSVKSDIQLLDAAISEIMSGQPRMLWEGIFWGGSQQSIIGYGDLTSMRANGDKVEWFIVGLAVQKNYISVYVNAVEDKQYLAEKYKDRLGKVKVGKSSISFKQLSDLNVPVFLELVEKAKDLTAK